MKVSNFICFFGLIAMASCKKTGDNDNLTIPPAQANFANLSGGTYYVKNDPNSVYKIPVGTTNVGTTNRNVAISVTSPTGAVSGTQYTLPASSATVPAGKALDSFSVKGLFAGYPGNRIDTLLFTITGGDVPVSDYNSVYRLVLRKYCDVVAANLTGAYANSRDYYPAVISTANQSAAKYTATISSWTPLTATTATIII